MHKGDCLLCVFARTSRLLGSAALLSEVGQAGLPILTPRCRLLIDRVRQLLDEMHERLPETRTGLNSYSKTQV